MRVALDWRPAVTGRGGIPAYVRALASAYAERFPGDALALYACGLRARIRRRQRPVPPATARVARAPVPALVAVALARMGFGPDRLVGGCDVLHLTDYAWLGRPSAPLVATVHDVLFEELPGCYTPAMRRGLRHVTRLLVRHAARLVVPSVRTKIALVERLGAAPERVDVVPLAPRALPDVPPARAPRPYVLALGTLEPRKNLARLLDAHAIARSRGAEHDLVVVGARGWLDEGLRARVASAPGARWEGEASDERLSALLRGALALAYPSLGEGFGLPVVEAMASGLAVVTSAGTACAEVAGDAALLVDPYDVEAIAAALALVESDGALRARLAARGRARAAAWSWTRTAEGTREAYVRAVA